MGAFMNLIGIQIPLGSFLIPVGDFKYSKGKLSLRWEFFFSVEI